MEVVYWAYSYSMLLPENVERLENNIELRHDDIVSIKTFRYCYANTPPKNRLNTKKLSLCPGEELFPHKTTYMYVSPPEWNCMCVCQLFVRIVVLVVNLSCSTFLEKSLIFCTAPRRGAR